MTTEPRNYDDFRYYLLAIARVPLGYSNIKKLKRGKYGIKRDDGMMLVITPPNSPSRQNLDGWEWKISDPLRRWNIHSVDFTWDSMIGTISRFMTAAELKSSKDEER